ncbi:EF-P lysine aminoacylase EpmA [Methylocapsa sp. S129]|uniref:EF-P lysine aminoacylase EpmA n=1 Tax=Methylocapsa sp. S129 TaxID=1641869 RepID=UPI00131D4A8B|nr:EF-P lysine aminoacylase EpmA [Methylocapsa sp. S129]
MKPPSPYWSKDRHADRRPRLLARARIIGALRHYFERQGFVEVEPAILQASPGNEAHLHGFATEIIGSDGAAGKAFLHTSPEFAMKKLLAAGEERIFAFSRVFRNRERGALHAPEFTMLEWYRAGADYEALMDDCAEIIAIAAGEAGARNLRFRGRDADPFVQPERLSVRDAFLRHAGIDLFESLTMDGGTADRARIAAQAVAAGLRVAPDDNWSDIFSRILSEKIEPALGLGRATVLCEYPAREAALARVNARDCRLADRFELYACGVELANAFGELTDSAEQRRRFEEEMSEKQRVYGETYPIDEDFLAALDHMPAASGAALGLDRLVMLTCGAERIEDVQWTPVFDPSWGVKA